MKGVNKVILIGHSGKDTEFKTLQNGTPVARLTIATTESYRMKNGEISHQTEWHSIILWQSLAAIAQKYIRKGSHIYVEGRLRNRSYEDKERQKRYVTEIVADQIVLLDKKPKAAEKYEEETDIENIPFQNY